MLISEAGHSLFTFPFVRDLHVEPPPVLMGVIIQLNPLCTGQSDRQCDREAQVI